MSYVRMPSLCREMRRRARELPEVIPAYQLRREQAYLAAYPALLEARLHEGRREEEMNEEERGRVERTLEARARVETGADGKRGDSRYAAEKRALLARIPEESEYRVSVHQARHRLGYRVREVGTCWMGDDYDARGEALRCDIQRGGSVVLFGERAGADGEYERKVFLRAFVAVDTAKEPLLFIDTIESGDEDIATVDGWKGREAELISMVAGGLVVGRQLGLGRVALGEDEANDIGEYLGVGRTRLFQETGGRRKIGRDVWMYKLERGTESWRTVDLGLAERLNQRAREAESSGPHQQDV